MTLAEAKERLSDVREKMERLENEVDAMVHGRERDQLMVELRAVTKEKIALEKLISFGGNQ